MSLKKFIEHVAKQGWNPQPIGNPMPPEDVNISDMLTTEELQQITALVAAMSQACNEIDKQPTSKCSRIAPEIIGRTIVRHLATKFYKGNSDCLETARQKLAKQFPAEAAFTGTGEMMYPPNDPVIFSIPNTEINP